MQRRQVTPDAIFQAQAAARNPPPAVAASVQYQQMPQHIGESTAEVARQGWRSSDWWTWIGIIAILALAIAIGIGLIVFAVRTNDQLDRNDRHCRRDNETCDESMYNEVIAESQRRSCDPAGSEEDGTGCFYSSNKVLQTKEAIFNYWTDDVSPASMLYATEFDWTRFRSGAQQYRYAKTASQKANYPALKNGKKVLKMIDQAVALPQTTDLERAQLLLDRQEVNFTVALYDLNFIHSEYEGGWNNHPSYDKLLILSVLPFFSGEPDYVDKALDYMENQLAADEALAQYYADILTEDAPPHVESEISCGAWGGLVGFMATPDLLDPICDVMPVGPQQTQCYAISADIDTAADDIATIYLGDYCTAAALHRPAVQPGLSAVHNGNLTYLAWLRYQSGIDMSVEERLVQAQAAIDEGMADVSALLLSTHGITYNDWLTALYDLDDPFFNVCFDTQDAVTRFFERASTNVSNVMNEVISYLPRAPHKVEDFGNCCFYSTGDYDPYTNQWLSPGRFLYGLKGLNSTDYPCTDRFVHSMTAHESWFGHHVQASLQVQLKCEIDTLWVAFTGFAEGWAAYTETLCNETSTLCVDPNEQIMNLYWTTLGTGGVLKADMTLQALGGTFADCEQINIDTGGGFFADKFCQRSYERPGQLAGYLQGSRQIVARRQAAEAALGSLFDLRVFNMLVSKFSRMPWSELKKLVDAWVVWTQDRAAGLLMPWGPTIDKVLFKSADPVVGTAFVVPDTGAVLVNSMPSGLVAALDANDNIAAWRNQTIARRQYDRLSFGSFSLEPIF